MGILGYTIAIYNGEPRDIPNIYLVRIFVSDLIKQLALSNYNEIDIDLLIVCPSPTH